MTEPLSEFVAARRPRWDRMEALVGRARGRVSRLTAAEVREPNGMAVATCGADGQPQCRVVLLKKLDERGLSFFTNRDSDKGQQLRQNARAAAKMASVACLRVSSERPPRNRTEMSRKA